MCGRLQGSGETGVEEQAKDVPDKIPGNKIRRVKRRKFEIEITNEPMPARAGLSVVAGVEVGQGVILKNATRYQVNNVVQAMKRRGWKATIRTLPDGTSGVWRTE